MMSTEVIVAIVAGTAAIITTILGLHGSRRGERQSTREAAAIARAQAKVQDTKHALDTQQDIIIEVRASEARFKRRLSAVERRAQRLEHEFTSLLRSIFTANSIEDLHATLNARWDFLTHLDEDEAAFWREEEAATPASTSADHPPT